MLERCVELGRGTEVASTGAFRILVSIGSVGVELEDAESGGSPAGTKFCCSSCNGDNVCSSSGRVIADDVANGDGLAGREEICLSLPKTRLGVSGSVVAPTDTGLTS